MRDGSTTFRSRCCAPEPYDLYPASGSHRCSHRCSCKIRQVTTLWRVDLASVVRSVRSTRGRRPLRGVRRPLAGDPYGGGPIRWDELDSLVGICESVCHCARSRDGWSVARVQLSPDRIMSVSPLARNSRHNAPVRNEEGDGVVCSEERKILYPPLGRRLDQIQPSSTLVQMRWCRGTRLPTSFSHWPLCIEVCGCSTAALSKIAPQISVSSSLTFALQLPPTHSIQHGGGATAARRHTPLSDRNLVARARLTQSSLPKASTTLAQSIHKTAVKTG